jgi:hypothetical protein
MKFFMAKKTALLAMLAFIAGFGAIHAQTPETEMPKVKMPKGFDIDVHLEVSMFGYEKNEKSDIDLRRRAGNYKPEMFYLPGARDGDWISDAGFSVGYDGGFFGGTLGMGTTTLNGRAKEVSDVGKFTTLKAWIKPFGDYLRFTAGVGIGSGYADSLGANIGMRIYNGTEQDSWDADRDPDNITQDQGALLEGFYGPFSLAIAARYYNPTVFALNLNPTTPAPVPGSGEDFRYTDWIYKNQVEYSYGFRLGYKIGDFGKVNGSYILEFSNYYGENQNFYGPDRDNNIVPLFGNSETTRHMFGVYAGLKPFSGFDVSLGYNGIVTKYLDEFYSLNTWQETSMPMVYQQALNLYLRYTGLDRWVFRTDHNVSFWTDQNYTIFGTSIKDRGVLSKSQNTGLADVNHILVWNGLGINYELTNTWKLDLYARNLFRQDAAIGVIDSTTKAEEEFIFTRDEMEMEFKAKWGPNPNLEFYIGMEVQYQLTMISKNVHERNVLEPNGFVSQKAVRDTADSTLKLRFPLGVTVRMR